MSFLVLLPALILAIGAVSVTLIAWQRPQFRSTWLVVVSVTFAAWGLLLGLRWLLPPEFVIAGWQPFSSQEQNSLSFSLDSVSWPYALSLVSLLLAMLVTASVRLQVQTRPWTWVGSMLITSTGLLAIMAGSPTTLLMTWTAVDLMELVVLLGLVKSQLLGRQVVLSFSVRVAGTFMVFWAILMSQNLGSPLTFDQVNPEVSVYLLIAAGLRLGVLPLNLPYTQEIPMRRGLGTMLRIVAPASSLVVLARLPAQTNETFLAPYITGFAILAVLYGSAMWLAADNELRGRPYWLVALAGFAVACVMQGYPLASISWGVSLILSGGLLFLYSARRRNLLFLPILSLLSLSGLPFTPSAAGWNALTPPVFQAIDLFFVVAMILIIVGYVRHSIQAGEPLQAFDRWAQVIYPVGLILLPINHWLTAIFGYRGSLAVGPIWSPILVLALSAALSFSIFRQRKQVEGLARSWLGVVAQRVGSSLAAFFRLNWLYRFFWLVYKTLQRLIGLVTMILEGEGGVLWAIVLLALLFSLISTGGQP